MKTELFGPASPELKTLLDRLSGLKSGDFSVRLPVEWTGVAGKIAATFNDAMERNEVMVEKLRVTAQNDADQAWLKSNLARFALMMQGQTDLHSVSPAILSELNSVVGSQHGVFYIAESRENKEIKLRMLSTFAAQPRVGQPHDFNLGEGLIGQCAKDKMRLVISNAPAGYIKISSGLGELKPSHIVVLPILFEKQIKGVLELASFSAFRPVHLDFLEQLMEVIGIMLNTLEGARRTVVLLTSLQSQQEELLKTNQALGVKADQLALTSKYKSEFLSNMSHELRTPLNSMLILAEQLADDTRNLTPKQVEYARTIHASGGDLLILINDILDLSKVESGTMVPDIEDLPFTDILSHLERVFRHVADGKGLGFSVEFNTGSLDRIRTDGKRLEQILRNLLSNAFKFTHKGHVVLKVETVREGWSSDHSVLSRAASVVAFTVTDTGIGIPLDKQKIIFEAFQQADSGTGRKFGGTGLGLSISRELTELLGCQLNLAKSVPGEGSTFVLYAPDTFVARVPGPAAPLATPASLTVASATAARPAAIPAPAAVADDRDDILPGDSTLLIIEDNPAFAGVILEAVRKRGFKGVVAPDGQSAVHLIDVIKPDAVTLDIRLPDMDGWGVLARFKNNPATRHVPVQIISVDSDRVRGIKSGAMSFLSKPVARQDLHQALESLRDFRARATRDLLLLCGEKSRCAQLTGLLEGDDVKISVVSTGEATLAALRKGRYDCLVMEVPDAESEKVLSAVIADPIWATLPIIVVNRRGMLSAKEESLVKRASESVALKEVRSLDRLLDETALYLHREVAKMTSDKKAVIEKLYKGASQLAGKKALVVDDDMRNVFAMTSLLENQEMVVVSAENGVEAVKALSREPDIDIVLMDIMMPQMDGYDTMQAIRKDDHFKTLPIIALTAKAMKGDREKCILLGASDYITKPVDTAQLLSAMRLWIHR